MKHIKKFSLNEKRPYKINQKDYKYYVFNTETNKIAEGFEYQEDAIDRIKELIEESGKLLKGKLRSCTRKALMIKDIDPDINENWADPNWMW